jgi:hypothetical protein
MHPFIRRIILLGTPLALAILNLFHPSSMAIRANLNWWITLHILNLPLFALAGLAAILLLAGGHSIIATSSRVLLIIFAVVYPAFDALLGIGSGIMVRFATTLPASQQGPILLASSEIFHDPITLTIGFVGNMAWLLGILTGVLALARPVWSRWLIISLVGVLIFFQLLVQANVILSLATPIWLWIVAALLVSVALAVVARPHLSVGLLAASAFFFSIDHSAPCGPLGMTLFLLAALQLEFLHHQQVGALSLADKNTP